MRQLTSRLPARAARRRAAPGLAPAVAALDTCVFVNGLVRLFLLDRGRTLVRPHIGELIAAHVAGRRTAAGINGTAASGCAGRRSASTIRGNKRAVERRCHRGKPMRTQVGIVGAGPAGLLLSHLLHRQGIESVVLDNRSRAEIEATIRAGVLEQGTVDLLNGLGLGERMQREGAVHHGIELRFAGRGHRIDLSGLTGGKAITVYAQHEVIKDLVAARLGAGGAIVFDAKRRRVQRSRRHDARDPLYAAPALARNSPATSSPAAMAFTASAAPPFRNRRARNSRALYPFGWFGILTRAPPSSQELIYTHHARGFALVSTRSPDIQRLYFQCDPHDDVAQLVRRPHLGRVPRPPRDA